jgi:amidohydrolase
MSYARGESMLEEARQIQAQLIQWPRNIHRRPELGFDVHRTAVLVATVLTDLGLEVRTGIDR